MKPLFDLMMELAGGITILFSAGLLIAYISGYHIFYDHMLYDDDKSTEVDLDESEDSDDQLLHDILEQLKY